MSALSRCHHWKLIGLLGVFSVVLGCVGGSNGHQSYRKEGFQFTLPNPGTRVVVRGNKAEAVNQALSWLNDHQLLVVNRQVGQDVVVPEFAGRNGTERQAQVLAGARKVGATLVVFVKADETPVNPTVDATTIDSTSVATQLMNKVVVDILGVNAETGEVAFGARAWNDEPLPASGSVVQDLTILALENAWQESAASNSPQEAISEDNTEQNNSVENRTLPVGALPVEPSAASPDTQPVSVESTTTAREQVTVFTEPVAEEVTPAPVVAAPVVAENSEPSDDPSLGLQIASGALSILYTPAKVVYAGLGGLVGGFVYLLTAGNEPAAQSVWDASLQGSYWITPDHLQGNEPVRFKGETAH